MNIVKFSDILKRSRSINSVIKESTDCNTLFDNIKSIIESGNYGVENTLRSYLNSMCDISNANKYYYQPLELLESYSDNKLISNIVLQEYTDRIIPYIKDNDRLELALERYNIPDELVDKILEAINKNKVVDRITENHNIISKRFSLLSDLAIYNIGSKKDIPSATKRFVESFAEMIDTYNMSDSNKFTVALEESFYLFEKYGYNYNKSDLVKYLSEYYLFNSDNLNNINEIKECIYNSPVLEEEDYRNIAYINNDNCSNSINNLISRFISNPDKSVDSINSLIDSIFTADRMCIISNIYNLIMVLFTASNSKIINELETSQVLFRVKNNLVDDQKYTREDMITIKQNILSAMEYIKSKNTNIDNDNFFGNIYDIINELDKTINIVYPTANINSMQTEGAKETLLALGQYGLNTAKGVAGKVVNKVKEAKPFKFHNLINATIHLNKFIKNKEKDLYNKMQNGIKSFTNKSKTLSNSILFGESVDYRQYITEAGYVEIPVIQYLFEENEEYDMTDFLTAVCNEYNTVLSNEGYEDITTYYILNCGVATIYLKDITPIDEDVIIEAFVDEVYPNSEELDIYIEQYLNINESMNILADKDLYSVDDLLENVSDCKGFTEDHYRLSLEAMSYLGIDKNTIKDFSERVNDLLYSKDIINNSYDELSISRRENRVNELAENYSIDSELSEDNNIRLEAYSYLLAIFEDAGKPKVGGAAIEANKHHAADDWDDEDDDEDEEDTKEEKKDDKEASKDNNDKKDENIHKATNNSKVAKVLNTIELGIKALGSNIKKMDAKEKDFSRKLDASSRNFIKAVKSIFVTTDRREAIIKGNLLPSFSQCIKNGIILAGLGVVTGGITAPIIALVGGLGVSKYLNDKERRLLLDEIETELEVVEKELSNADSNGNMKQYRSLLNYKKNLQRQYQRIRYNIRVGKDISVSSSDGIGRSDD